MAHRIRLRGPWRFEWHVASEDGVDEETRSEGTVRMPAAFADFLPKTEIAADRGALRLRRVFHRPTNLEPQERVLVVFENPAVAGEVRIGDTLLGRLESGGGTSAAFDITAQLAQTNELVVDCRIALPPPACQPWEAVSLLIEQDGSAEAKPAC